MTRHLMIAAILTGAGASYASASTTGTTHVWDWTPASTDGSDLGYEDNGGRINSIHAEFNPATSSLIWLVNFGSVPNHSSWKTDGFTLALNNGPNPKGHAGELALLYFDASRSTPVLTAYGYNGQNSVTTFYDGSHSNGTQFPDLIDSSRGGPGWVHNLIKRDESNGSRTLGFEINVSHIINHSPLYTGPGGAADWYGIGFDGGLGIWMHSFAKLSTSYIGDYLTDWDAKEEGWLDGSHFTTVPEPGTLALLAFGGLTVLRRRRAMVTC